MTSRKLIHRRDDGWLPDEAQQVARELEIVHPFTCRRRGCRRRIASLTFGLSHADRESAMLTFWGPFLGNMPDDAVYLVGYQAGRGTRQVRLDDAPDPIAVVCGCGHRNELNRTTLRALVSGAIVDGISTS